MAEQLRTWGGVKVGRGPTHERRFRSADGSPALRRSAPSEGVAGVAVREIPVAEHERLIAVGLLEAALASADGTGRTMAPWESGSSPAAGASVPIECHGASTATAAARVATENVIVKTLRTVQVSEGKSIPWGRCANDGAQCKSLTIVRCWAPIVKHLPAKYAFRGVPTDLGCFGCLECGGSTPLWIFGWSCRLPIQKSKAVSSHRTPKNSASPPVFSREIRQRERGHDGPERGIHEEDIGRQAAAAVHRAGDGTALVSGGAAQLERVVAVAEVDVHVEQQGSPVTSGVASCK